MIKWKFCPECGCSEVHYEDGQHKQCKECHQEWFSDVDYSDIVAKKIGKAFNKEKLKTALIEKARTVGFLSVEDIESVFMEHPNP